MRSLADLLADLESKVAFHRRQEGLCAELHEGRDLPGVRLEVAARRPGANLNALLDENLRDPLSGNAS